MNTNDWRYQRPLITMEELAQLAKMDAADCRKLCLSYMLPIVTDDNLGELLSISTVVSFFRHLRAYENPAHFDRAHLLLWMLGVEERHVRRDPPGYDARLEEEIFRISRLPEPERTIRGVELLTRFIDAKKVARSVIDGRARDIERKLRRLTKTT